MTRGNPGARHDRAASGPRRSSSGRVDDALSSVLCYGAGSPVGVIALPPGVDAECIAAVLGHSERLLAAGSRAIVVDLSTADRVDTRTLGELGVALRGISRHAVAVAVVGADPRVQRVLELCGIEGLRFHRTVRRARADVRVRPRRAIRLPGREVLRRQPRADGAP